MTRGSEQQDGFRLVALAIGFLGTFFIVAGLVWAMYHFGRPDPLAEDRTELRLRNLGELKAADVAALEGYSWRDQARGVVRLPIGEAMQVMVQEWQDPAAARSNLIARVEQATAPPPKAPEAPNPYE
jgi:hypothetical protein